MFKDLLKPFLDFTIKLKLQFTYVFFLFIVLVGTSVFIYTGFEQKETIVKVTQKTAPIVNHLLSIREGISEMSAMSGLYMLTREKGYHEKYANALKSLREHISALEKHKLTHPEMVQDLAKIKKSLVELDKGFREVMNIAIDDLKNQPALQLASSDIGPLFNQILSITTSMIDSENETDELTEERRAIFRTIYEIRSIWTNLSRNITVFLTYRNEGFANEFMFSIDQLKEKFEVLSEAEDLTFEQEIGLEELQPILDDYTAALKKLVPLHIGNGWRKDSQLIRKDLGPLLKDIRQAIDNVVKREQLQADEEVNTLLDDIDSFSRNTLIVAVITTLGAIIIIILLNILVVHRLSSTQEAMHKISSGGGLGHTLDETGKDELSTLAVDFNKFIAQIKTIVELVIQSSENLANESQKMSTITECALDLSNTQDGKVSEISGINNAMSEQVVSIANNAGEAAKAIEGAKLTAEKGRTMVQQTIESVQAIANEVQSSSQVVTELAADTESISSVIAVIQSISEQTNLLALNAAIEAARAGEAGRGFAVVADEVRNLSHKIQGETVVIKQKIESLQSASTGVVEEMNSMQTNTEKTVELSSQAGNAFDEIVSEVIKVTTMNQQNAEATEEQRKSNEKVNAALEHLTIMAKTMANTTQDAYQSGQEFRIMAEQLKDIVQQFTVSADEPGKANLTSAKTPKALQKTDQNDDNIDLF